MYTPGRLTDGLKFPKLPPVNTDGPVQVPVFIGVPPSIEKRLTGASFPQSVIVPFVPAFEGDTTFTVMEAVEVHPLAAVPTTVYVVFTLGFAVTEDPVTADKPAAGDHA